MPDPYMKTVSASEAAALFNASPYLTRWMLYQKFANKLDISRPSSDRMNWGKKLQSAIIEQVAEDKKLVVIPNITECYDWRGHLGCTVDSVIICPERGPGALEIKCVFDYNVWAATWRGGTVPRHYEIQLQTQMLVGDGTRPYEWGMIAVWVCAKMYYFERKPIQGLWHQLLQEAELFFEQVSKRAEPDPFGAACEAPFLTALFQTRADSVLDLSNDPEHVKTAADVGAYQAFKEMRAGAERVAEEKRVKFLALAKDYAFVKLPCGVGYRVAKSGKGKTIIPYIPETPLPPPPSKGPPIIAAG
jgi:predicted phage-related endonuclease